MFSFQRWWRAIAAVTAFACGTVALAAPSLTTIKDVLYKADGTRFNGTVTITWSNFSSADQTTIPVQSITVEVVNGAFTTKLVPTTTASAGANYRVRYASQGKFQFEEIWAVPPSALPLVIRDVRVGTGSVVGPPPVLTQVDIADVTGLSAELNQRVRRGSGFTASRAAVISASGQIDAASGNLEDCVRVDGTSGPCGSGAESSSIAFADAETPAGAVNGTNATFTTANVPAPAASLALFRNGILMKPGADFTLTGDTMTFVSGATPQAGDLLTVSYRYAKAGQLPVAANFVDAETPAGSVNGSNVAYTLTEAPSPSTSLQLFRNGVLMKQGADYSLGNKTILFTSGAVPQTGDLLQASYRYGGMANPTASSYYSGPQVLCNGAGSSTGSVEAAGLGECVIPAGLLAPGDRVEIRMELAHQGSAAGFSASLHWGDSLMVARSAPAAETAFSVRADAVIFGEGAQWSAQSWGASTALSSGAGTALDARTDPITVRFAGAVAQAGGDVVSLRNFTVLRYPGQL